MASDKYSILDNLNTKLGVDDEDLTRLVDIVIEEEKQIASYKDVVCDTVNAYHNEKKELITLIEELVTVLSAAMDRPENQTKKQEELLKDTCSNLLIKAFSILNH